MPLHNCIRKVQRQLWHIQSADDTHALLHTETDLNNPNCTSSTRVPVERMQNATNWMSRCDSCAPVCAPVTTPSKASQSIDGATRPVLSTCFIRQQLQHNTPPTTTSCREPCTLDTYRKWQSFSPMRTNVPSAAQPHPAARLRHFDAIGVLLVF